MANTAARARSARTTGARTRPAGAGQGRGPAVRRTSRPPQRALGRRPARKGSGGLLSTLGRKAPTPRRTPGKGALIGGGVAALAAAATALKKRRSGSPAGEAIYTPAPDALPNEPVRPAGVSPSPGTEAAPGTGAGPTAPGTVPPL